MHRDHSMNHDTIPTPYTSVHNGFENLLI